MEDRHERQSGQVGQGGTDGWQVPRHAGMPKRPTSLGAVVARTLVLVFGVLPLLIAGGIMAYCSLRNKFEIVIGKPCELATPTMDAGTNYTLSLSRE